jgi:sortase A
MKRKVMRILAALLLLISAGVLSYPYWSRWYAGELSGRVVQTYANSVDVMSPAYREKLWQEALAYNERLAKGALTDEKGLVIGDPFSGGSEQAPFDYLDILEVPGSRDIMAVLELPTLGQELPIYHGVSEQVLQRGIGHLPQSALPVGGANTHSVLAGHRGLSSALLFTDLDKLKRNDRFHIRVLDHILAYEVDSIAVVKPYDISSLSPKPGKDLVTLATCTPLGINSHRLLVQGHRVPYIPEPVRHPTAQERQFLLAAGIVGLALLLIALMRLRGRTRH